ALVFGEDGVPFGGFLPLAEVRDLLAGEDADGGGLAHAVGAEDARRGAQAGCGEPEEAEAVLAVLVHEVVGEGLGESDDADGVEGALVDADAAPDAELLGDDGLAEGRIHLDGVNDTGADGGAEADALLLTLAWLAAVLQQ